MQFQIIKKAIFYEFDTIQAPDAEGHSVQRSILSATYKYYLVKKDSILLILLEQEHWTGEFAGFCTHPLAEHKALQVYSQMIACGNDPSQIPNLGIAGDAYEKTDASIDVLENDFGVLDLSEEHFPIAMENPDNITTGGFKPFIPGDVKEAVPTVSDSSLGLLGPQYVPSTSAPPTSVVSSIPLGDYGSEEEDSDVSSLPGALQLPEGDQRSPENAFHDSLITKRPPSNTSSFSGYDEDEDGDDSAAGDIRDYPWGSDE